jgi:hypothetical protein
VLEQILGHKMSETYWGLNTCSEAYLPRFLTPTQTHVSDTHSHDYGHFGTVTCGASGLLENWVIEWVGAFGTFTDSIKIITFKLVITLVD